MDLWSKLPVGLLRMQFETWRRLPYDVKLLIISLAHEQEFKCAHCDATRRLEIDHDHYPEHETGDRYTIYNVRGLVCRKCNWAIGMHEAEQRGEYNSWPDSNRRVSEGAFYDYDFSYQCRVSPLIEEVWKQRLGIQNYWKRRKFLSKFDDWKEGWGSYPWYWGFDEIKDRKYGPIRTPKHFLQIFLASMRYVAKEVERNPNYEPPKVFWDLMERAKPILDAAQSVVEERRQTQPTLR